MKKERIKAAIYYAGKTAAQVAENIDTSKQNFTMRTARESWSASDLERIAAAIGAEYVEFFRFPDGKEI